MMIEARQYNQLLLRWFNDLVGIPQSRSDAITYTRSRVHRPCEAETDRALAYLESAKYIERIEATVADEPLYKITALGMQQAERMVPKANLDPMIWAG
jgi:hypothetical protein